MTSQRVYIGTFTGPEGAAQAGTPGIFLCHFDSNNGRLEKLAAFAGGSSPAFLAFSASGDFLYCVNETDVFQGQPGGGVSAFKVDRNSGGLTYLNSQSSLGAIPCYLSLDPTGTLALAANYTGGNVAVFPLGADGCLGPASDCIQHPNLEGQRAPHPHLIRVGPDPHNVWVTDLGLNQMRIYRLDTSQGKLHPHDPALIELHPGAGPRHLDFHPNGCWLYVLNELDSTLDAYTLQAGSGLVAHLQTSSTLPPGVAGVNWPADVHVHPDGRFVIASNRGHDSLAVFAIHPETGRLEPVDSVSSGGKTPINFTFDPTGQWVIAANTSSNSLNVLAFDEAHGKLTLTGEALAIPAPACVQFAF